MILCYRSHLLGEPETTIDIGCRVFSGVDIKHKIHTPTVGGTNPANHLRCIKPRKEWDKLPTSTGDRRISEASTVSFGFSSIGNYFPAISFPAKISRLL